MPSGQLSRRGFLGLVLLAPAIAALAPSALRKLSNKPVILRRRNVYVPAAIDKETLAASAAGPHDFIDLPSMNAALKEMYSGVQIQDFAYSRNPLLALVSR